MPQIDFTIFFIFVLWLFPIFFSVFFYSLVYIFPILVLQNKVILYLRDLAVLKTLFFLTFKSLSSWDYLKRLS